MRLWLIGAGGMAVDYAKVLDAMGREFTAIGRGEASAGSFEKQTGHKVLRGGVAAGLAGTEGAPPDVAIVAVGAEVLFDSTKALIDAGLRRILVEKPAALSLAHIRDLRDMAARREVILQVAYNRRYYSSVRHALALIEEDGGVTSMNFEFTEWSHVIAPLDKALGIKERWLLGNSTHVIDMAFHMGGRPREIECRRAGSLSWHPAGAAFVGSGITYSGALFSYQANWAAPGRWGVELCTANRRLIFRPLETLQVMKRGSVTSEAIAVPDSQIDKDFKPGLYRQVEGFLSGPAHASACSIAEHADNAETYYSIAGY